MDNNLLGTQYDLPKNRDEFININSGEVVKQDIIDPMDVIRKVAEKTGTKIQNPNPKCKFKGCYGRGYIGRDAKTKAPIPCKCIFPKVEGEELIQRQVAEESMRKMTKKEKRLMAAHAKRLKKKKNKKEWQKKQNKKKNK